MRMRQITAANEAGAVTLGESRSLVIVLGDERVVLHSFLAVSTPPTCALLFCTPLSTSLRRRAMLRLVSSASRPSSAGVLAKVAATPSSTRPGIPPSLFGSSELVPKWLRRPYLWLGRRTFASSSSRQADITLTVDGKEVTVPQGACLDMAS